MAISFPLLQPRQWVRQPPKKFPNQSLMPTVTYSSITQCHLQGCDNHAGKIPQTQQSSQRVDLQPEVQTGASVCSCGLVFCSALPPRYYILNFTDFFQSSRGRLRAANHLDIFWNLYFTAVCTERTTLVFISNLPVDPARQLRFF